MCAVLNHDPVAPDIPLRLCVVLARVLYILVPESGEGNDNYTVPVKVAPFYGAQRNITTSTSLPKMEAIFKFQATLEGKCLTKGLHLLII